MSSRREEILSLVILVFDKLNIEADERKAFQVNIIDGDFDGKIVWLFFIFMDRWYWVESFKNLNLTTAEIMNMDEDEFHIRCRFLTEAGLGPGSVYKGVSKGKHADSSASIIENNIIKQQDDEYEQALKEEKEKQEGERMCEFRERLKARISEEIMEESKGIREENRKKAEKLNNEGDVQIVFLFPSGKRVHRRFSSKSYGEDLFSFVGAQDEMYREDCTQKEFRLLHGMNTDVCYELRLEEQCIGNRSMIKVICE